MLVWIESNQPLPPIEPVDPEHGDPEQSEGLIAAGYDISANRLMEAYGRGIFPWYVEGQPVLWWSPHPRMVLMLDELIVPKSLRKTIRNVAQSQKLRITINQQFAAVMRACAEPRADQDGTWITDEMLDAYCALHEQGNAQSVEMWSDNDDGNPELVGGLYGVSIGRMFYGESMFTRVSDASKIALVALVHLLKSQGFRMIDCQQNTAHLARFGAKEIDRSDFLSAMAPLTKESSPNWRELSIQIPHV
jgi:leucyl/phenylalanyl-tRNA--protein transferase